MVKNENNGKLFSKIAIAHLAVNSGMITNFGRGFAKMLVDEGADLHVFASKLNVYGFPPEIDDIEKNIGAKFHGLPLNENFSPWRYLFCFFKMLFLFKKLRIKVLHTRGTVMGIIGRAAGKILNIPIIFHHQDDLYFRDNRLKKWQKILIGGIEKFFANNFTDYSFFVSSSVLNDAISLGFNPEKCLLVGHDLRDEYINASRMQINKDNPIMKYLNENGVPSSSNIIGSIGRLSYIKGYDLLIEAAREIIPKYSNWIFVVKGDGPLKKELKKKIKMYDLEKNFFILDKSFEDWQMPFLYKCFDIFILPTRREGFGMVFAESMAMGLPVIGPRIPPITEVVTENYGKLYEPENIESMSNAIVELIENEELRRDLSAKAKEYVLNKYGGEKKASNKVIDWYIHTLKEKGLL